MVNDPANLPSHPSVIRRALQWKIATRKQVWVLAGITALAGSIGGYLMAYFWLGHASWLLALGWAGYMAAVVGLLQSYQLRRRSRRR